MSDIKTINLHFPSSAPPPKTLTQERARALKDLEKSAKFQPTGNDNGPYRIELSLENNRLVLKIQDTKEVELPYLIISLSPYKRIIKDYFMMIDSYEQLRPHAITSKLETIDMARRGIHNEAAEIMIDRFKDKIIMDLETARRLFTLMCALHIGSVKSGWV